MLRKVARPGIPRSPFVPHGIENFFEILVSTGVRLYTVLCCFLYDSVRNLFAAMQNPRTAAISLLFVFEGAEDTVDHDSRILAEHRVPAAVIRAVVRLVSL